MIMTTLELLDDEIKDAINLYLLLKGYTVKIDLPIGKDKRSKPRILLRYYPEECIRPEQFSATIWVETTSEEKISPIHEAMRELEEDIDALNDGRLDFSMYTKLGEDNLFIKKLQHLLSIVSPEKDSEKEKERCQE